MIPPAILAEHRRAADQRLASDRPRSLLGALIVVAIWVVAALGVIRLALRRPAGRA